MSNKKEKLTWQLEIYNLLVMTTKIYQLSVPLRPGLMDLVTNPSLLGDVLREGVGLVRCYVWVRRGWNLRGGGSVGYNREGG
jgi:hypothetical protein